MTDFDGPGNYGEGMSSVAMVPKPGVLLSPVRSSTSGFAGATHANLTFDEVYATYFDFVWRSVRRLGVDVSGVDDVVQDVFFAVHRRLGDFEGRSSLRTWIFSIVVHFVRHHRRTGRRKGHPGESATDPDMLADVRAPGPFESAERRETVRVLDDILRCLDDDKREVFVLSELAQMTAAEIAEIVGTSVNTIYSRLRAARQEFELALARHRAREPRRSP